MGSVCGKDSVPDSETQPQSLKNGVAEAPNETATESSVDTIALMDKEQEERMSEHGTELRKSLDGVAMGKHLAEQAALEEEKAAKEKRPSLTGTVMSMFTSKKEETTEEKPEEPAAEEETTEEATEEKTGETTEEATEEATEEKTEEPAAEEAVAEEKTEETTEEKTEEPVEEEKPTDLSSTTKRKSIFNMFTKTESAPAEEPAAEEPAAEELKAEESAAEKPKAEAAEAPVAVEATE